MHHICSFDKYFIQQQRDIIVTVTTMMVIDSVDLTGLHRGLVVVVVKDLFARNYKIFSGTLTLLFC